jgi:hypothetical protein
MSQKEFSAWIEFWKTCPFDDAGRYHRPAALVANAMNGRDINEALKWLSRELTLEDQGYSEADANTLRAFGLKPPKKENA